MGRDVGFHACFYCLGPHSEGLAQLPPDFVVSVEGLVP